MSQSMVLRTRLIHDNSLPALTVQRCREILSAARVKAAAHVSAARTKAARRLLKARRRAFERGYLEGLREGRAIFDGAIESARSLTLRAHEEARTEAFELAYRLAEEILQETLPERPERYRLWLSDALEILGKGPFKLLHHPELAPTAEKLGLEPSSNVTVEASPMLPPMTMQLVGGHGAVEFAWQEALTRARGSVQ